MKRSKTKRFIWMSETREFGRIHRFQWNSWFSFVPLNYCHSQLCFAVECIYRIKLAWNQKDTMIPLHVWLRLFYFAMWSFIFCRLHQWRRCCDCFQTWRFFVNNWIFQAKEFCIRNNREVAITIKHVNKNGFFSRFNSDIKSNTNINSIDMVTDNKWALTSFKWRILATIKRPKFCFKKQLQWK